MAEVDELVTMDGDSFVVTNLLVLFVVTSVLEQLLHPKSSIRMHTWFSLKNGRILMYCAQSGGSKSIRSSVSFLPFFSFS